MPCNESITNAKASFVGAVSGGITTLMQQCGYSRERAISALLREINRGDSARPTDNEVSTHVHSPSTSVTKKTSNSKWSYWLYAKTR